jgi:hypothetical protein
MRENEHMKKTATGNEIVPATTALEVMSDFFNHRAHIYEAKHVENIGGMESK